MGRTADRQHYDVMTRLDLLERDADVIEAGQAKILSRVNLAIGLMGSFTLTVVTLIVQLAAQ